MDDGTAEVFAFTVTDPVKNMKKLANGINLNVLTTDKFQSVRIVAEFYAPFEKVTAANRALLAQILEDSSAFFPNRQLLTKKLNTLYGAHFSVSTSRFGRLSKLRFALKIPSPQAAGDQQLLAKSFNFLSGQIFNPLIVDGLFPEHLFENEKQNFLSEFLANFDNKSYKLHDLILKKYFVNPDFRIQPEGSPLSIRQLTNETVVSAYRAMRANDEMSLEVAGLLSELEVEKLVASWPNVSQNSRPIPNPVYTQAVKPDQFAELHEKGDQALLERAYNFLDYDYLTQQRYTAMVFSRLFGGSSQSLLFLNIREKLHLAYYANSTFFAVDGWMTVQAGLDKDNVELVKNEIDLQLERVKKQDFSNDLFTTIKEELVAAIQAGEDYEETAIEKSINAFLTGYALSSSQIIAVIQSVTPQQVADFANKSVKQAEAVLINED
ncbi:MAG: insulinase family protein [Oenococcus sp.]|uniref:EF-P 5-aminopentanol modification-associated protein YfmF n=1 Tax=Oenococcus sp. TaxID=1979414 RepID=UPI0039EA981E